MKNAYKSIRTGMMVLGGLSLSHVAYSEGAGQVSLEEVIVTSRMKSVGEAAQDIPIAATAFNADSIEAAQVVTLTDIGRLTPNALLGPTGSFPGNSSFYIRGMGAFSSIPSVETAVGSFMDGVYFGVSAGSLSNLFSVESVEVLRGPQGTLFGRNVTGGAVVVKSKRPEVGAEFGGRAKASYSRFDMRTADLSLEGSLSDTVAASVAAGYRGSDDKFENDFGDDRGQSDAYYVRPIVVFEPNEDLTFTLIGEIQDYDGDGIASKNVADTPPFGSVPTAGDHKVELDSDSWARMKTKHLIGEVNWDVGPGTLTSIVGWRDVKTSALSDLDGRRIPFLTSSPDVGWQVEQDQASAEIRYAMPIGDDSDITFGAYYFEQDMANIDNRVVFGGPPSVSFGALDHSTWAVFAQSGISLAEDLVLTIGGRYTYEEKEALVASTGNCNADASICTFDFQDSEDWQMVNAYLNLDYAFSDNAHVYGSWTLGNRSGGFNLRNTAPSSPGPYDNEEVKALEVGLKADWLDKRLRTNIAAFHNEYKDLQRTIQFNDPGRGVATEILNAADATIMGLEAEITAILTEELRVDLTAGYTNAEYDQFILDVDGDNIPDPDLAKGLELANVPELTWSGTITYETTLDNGNVLSLRTSAQYLDERFADDANTFALEDFTVVDASASYSMNDGKYKVTLYGKNLTDKEYVYFAVAPIGALWQLQDPRTYGVEFAVEF